MGLIGMKKESFSEQENRYLEAFPKWSWENVKDGSYMEDLSSYVSDHFPFRDFFMGMKTKTEIALGKCEINGVYIADDGYLIEEYHLKIQIRSLESCIILQKSCQIRRWI